MLNKIFCFFLCWLTLVANAQIQQGYVKTLGRPNQKGVALSGVSIRAKGAHNAVLSNSQGIFSMSLPGKKNGESYQLQQVQKQGYELSEQGVLGRNYAFSDKVSLTITMVNSRQLQADKQRIENKAYEVAERNYKSRLAALEKQRDANSITIENYREQLQELQNRFDKYQSLIEGLADHYAHVDYDNLDEAERTINLCIENGDLERADSLLQQLGVYNLVEEIHRHLQSGEKLMAEANQDMAAIMKQQDKDAEYLYQLYTIALAKFDNDKARFYIETRAELDTNVVRWQIDAAEYVLEYYNDFEKAQAYLNLGISKTTANSFEYAECLNDLGSIYILQGKYDMAEKELLHSLSIRKEIVGEDDPATGVAYNTLGACMYSQGKHQEALDYHHKSLAIRLKTYGEQSEKVALAYHNIALTYLQQNKYDEAISYLEKALSNVSQDNGNRTLILRSSIYEGLGIAYSKKAEFEKKKMPVEALDYKKKALDIRLQLYGENNLSTAISYHNIGAAYIEPVLMEVLNNDTITNISKSDYEKGLSYLLKSLEIKRMFLDEQHSDIKETKTVIGYLGIAYCTLGFRNMEKGDYTESIQNFITGSEMLKKVDISDNYSFMVTVNTILGTLLQKMELFEESITYLEYAMELSKAIHSDKDINSLSSEIKKTYSLWLNAEPNNIKAREGYQKY